MDRHSLFNNLNNVKGLHALIKNKTKKRSFVIEVGCGEGYLLPTLAENSGSVIAIESSQARLHKAAKKASHYKNIRFIHGNFINLHVERSVDLIIAINSIFEGRYQDINLQLTKIHEVLKRKGNFIGVFPSMEAYTYLAFLHAVIHTKSEKSLNRSLKKAETSFFKKFDFSVFGTHKIKSKYQKFFYEFELKLMLEIIGFKNIKVKKIPYSWDFLNQEGIKIKQKEKFWDWLVVAEK
jgi:ubiquinone/menaquinone biosynthesis C-methylase UbiE